MRTRICKWLPLAALTLIFASCASDEPIVKTEANQRQANNPFRKPLDEALNSADTMLSLISDKPLTRASRQIESVRIIGDSSKALTRSNNEETDTLFYLVNYANDQGFALLSADYRTKPVYAISDEGNLNFADTTFNKGLAIFLDNAQTDCSEIIAGIRGPFIPIDTPDIHHPVFPDLSYKFEILHEQKPLIKKWPSRWDQEDPFNKYCFNSAGIKCPAGCVAIATAMLCSYKKLPSKYSGRTLNWDVLNNLDIEHYKTDSNADDLAFFLHEIGINMLAMNYHPTGSGSHLSNAKDALNRFEIRTSDILEYTNHCAGYPAMITASTEPDKNGEVKAHAWVIDGYQSVKITNNMLQENQIYYEYFEHCVWGWGGMSNGYYSWSSAAGFGSKPDHWADDDLQNYTSHTSLYLNNFKYLYLK